MRAHACGYQHGCACMHAPAHGRMRCGSWPFAGRVRDRGRVCCDGYGAVRRRKRRPGRASRGSAACSRCGLPYSATPPLLSSQPRPACSSRPSPCVLPPFVAASELVPAIMARVCTFGTHARAGEGTLVFRTGQAKVGIRLTAHELYHCHVAHQSKILVAGLLFSPCCRSLVLTCRASVLRVWAL